MSFDPNLLAERVVNEVMKKYSDSSKAALFKQNEIFREQQKFFIDDSPSNIKIFQDFQEQIDENEKRIKEGSDNTELKNICKTVFSQLFEHLKEQIGSEFLVKINENSDGELVGKIVPFKEK